MEVSRWGAEDTHTFHIKNMHCDSCAALIDETLLGLTGIHEAHSTIATSECVVVLDARQTSPRAVTYALSELGFRLTIRPADPPSRVARPRPLSDTAWAVIAPLLRDRKPKTGKPARDHRQVFEGLAYKYRRRVPWREIPAEFGPWQTSYARLARWHKDGTWQRVVTVARRRPDLAEELAWVLRARVNDS